MKIKNKYAVLTGIATALIVIILIREIFQAGTAYFLGAEEISFKISGLELFCSFTITENQSTLSYILIFISPILFIFIALEIGIRVLQKTVLGFYRYAAIVFQLLLIGFLIINIFYGAVTVVLKMEGNDWNRLVYYLDLSYEGGIIFMFLVIIIFAAYLNLSIKRVIGYINA